MLKGAVLIKGGHLTDTADDLLYANGRILWIRGERVNNPNNHGTGCTLSSAIACNLAQGLDIEISVRNAKNYITGALKSNLNLGRGRGPLNHVWEL
jgi:hydroxymethylpyrimidine/phosphomethylpyrimidine kinase